MAYTTYENYTEPHITIHKATCGHLRKHGGVGKYKQLKYMDFQNLFEAEKYAESTNLPLRRCRCLEK